MEGRIQRSLLDLKYVSGYLLDSLGDGIPVNRSGRDDLED